MSAAPWVIGVFDAGIGGIPMAAMLAERGHQVVYLGDAARRPYGPQPNEVVARYVAEAERFFDQAGCDAWVIACNTASVVAHEALAGTIPCVDMVSAVVHEYPAIDSGPIGLLATAGTVASGAFIGALPAYDVHQVATEELLRIAEEGGGDASRIRALAAEAFTEVREAGCAEVILACTDFTCVMEHLIAESQGLALLDPVDAAVALLQETLAGHGRRDKRTPTGQAREGRVRAGHTSSGHRLVLTGPHPVDVAAFAHDRYGLELPEPEYLPLDRYGVAITGA